jgi:hypothetical protein
MPISDDWDFNYSAKVLSHIDGILSYDTGGGSQAAVGDYVRGSTSGALGKVLANTGDATSGTLTLTNVLGQFSDGELLEALSTLDFDGVITAGQDLIQIGAVISGATGVMTIRFIEYNIDGTAGHGTFYGDTLTTGFVNNETLSISATNVCLADQTETDNSAKLTTTLTDGVLAVPGTANTNNCEIIHYDDAGTILVPDDAKIADTTGLTGAEGYAQKVWGTAAVGSIRVIDSDVTGAAWLNNNSLYIHDVVYYDTLVAGKVFSVGDVVRDSLTTTIQGRVLAVIDDGDSTGKLILGSKTAGSWADAADLEVLQADDTWDQVAEVENGQNFYLDTGALINIPSGSRKVQRDDQGGIFPTLSLNLVRSANAFYTYAVELFAELGQLDDKPALDGDVRDQLYTILNDYIIPDLSFRFIEKGAFKDTPNNNLIGNFQSAGVVNNVGDHGFFYDTTNPTPQPDIYLEQNGEVQDSWWLEGHVDILVKVKSTTNPRFIDTGVEALGQLIDGGSITLHLRPYFSTYDSAQSDAPAGGQNPVFISNADDSLNNATHQYSATQSGGSGTFEAGEEALTTDGKRVVVTNAATGGSGDIEYNEKNTGNPLVSTDAITGVVSGATSTINVITDVVAGYDADIRVMVVQRRFTEDVAPSTAFVLGELVTQTGTSATGYFMEYDGTYVYIEEQAASTPFSATGVLTGANSSCTFTPSATETWGDADAAEGAPKDIGGGVGDKNYKIVVSADITRTVAATPVDPQPVLNVYEWWKFILARESSGYEVNLPGQGYTDFVQGRIYRRAWPSFAEVKGASQMGGRAGTLVQGAQGVFIEKGYLDSGDIRNIQLIDNLGDTYDPPNLQVAEIIGLTAGVKAALYRSDGAGSTAILRTEFDVGTLDPNNRSGDSTIMLAAGDRSVSPLPNDVPDTGILRILDPNDTGNYLSFIYASVNRTTNVFTLASGTIGDITSSQDLTPGDDAHVVFIETTSAGASVNNTIQYVANINMVAVARVKGKEPFEAAAVFGTSGVSIGAVLNNDTVVNLP